MNLKEVKERHEEMADRFGLGKYPITDSSLADSIHADRGFLIRELETALAFIPVAQMALKLLREHPWPSTDTRWQYVETGLDDFLKLQQQEERMMADARQKAEQRRLRHPDGTLGAYPGSSEITGLLCKQVDSLQQELERAQGLISAHIEMPVPDDDPVQEIGERLADLLDADQFNWFEPKLNGIRQSIIEAEATLARIAELPDKWRDEEDNLIEPKTDEEIDALPGGVIPFPFTYCADELDEVFQQEKGDG